MDCLVASPCMASHLSSYTASLVFDSHFSGSSHFAPAGPHFCLLITWIPLLFLSPPSLKSLSVLKPHFLLSWSTHIYIYECTHPYTNIYNFKFSFHIWEKNAIFIWVWLISLSIMISSCVHFPINVIIHVFFTATKNSIVSVCVHACAKFSLLLNLPIISCAAIIILQKTMPCILKSFQHF